MDPRLILDSWRPCFCFRWRLEKKSRVDCIVEFILGFLFYRQGLCFVQRQLLSFADNDIITCDQSIPDSGLEIAVNNRPLRCFGFRYGTQGLLSILISDVFMLGGKLDLLLVIIEGLDATQQLRDGEAY